MVVAICCALGLFASSCGTEDDLFSPNTWTELRSDGPVPSPRAGHALVYDSSTAKFILFGGVASSMTGSVGSLRVGSAQTYRDTWTFDLPTNTWTELTPSGAVPSARAGHAMVYDPLYEKVILFGGSEFSSDVRDPLGDTWVYDPSANTWTEVTPAGPLPPPRFDHTMVCDPASGKVILFGGRGTPSVEISGDTSGDIWVYDPSPNTWTELEPAGSLHPARHSQVMAFDPKTGRVMLFAGVSSTMSAVQNLLVLGDPTVYQDVWAYDLATNAWSEITPAGSVPSLREDQAAVCDTERGRVLLFGGASSGTSEPPALNDTWAYDLATGTWTESRPAGALPPGRAMHAMAYDPLDESVILFGGVGVDPSSGEFRYLGDTWMYVPAVTQ